MKLEDLKVIDIIQMPQFEKHIEALIKEANILLRLELLLKE